MSELRDLCALVDAADARMSTAGQVASQDDVALAQREYHEASAKMDARVKEIGLALHERGGEDAMREVLVRLEREYGRPRRRAMSSICGGGSARGPETHSTPDQSTVSVQRTALRRR